MIGLYLAGPIRWRPEEFEQDREWRDKVSRIVSAMFSNVTIYDPTEGVELADSENYRLFGEEFEVTNKSILYVCLAQIERCDVVLANLLAYTDYPCIGTLMECGAAMITHKILTVAAYHPLSAHPFVEMGSVFTHHELDMVIDYTLGTLRKLGAKPTPKEETICSN